MPGYECSNLADLSPSLTCNLGVPKMHTRAPPSGHDRPGTRCEPGLRFRSPAPGGALPCSEKREMNLAHCTAQRRAARMRLRGELGARSGSAAWSSPALPCPGARLGGQLFPSPRRVAARKMLGVLPFLAPLFDRSPLQPLCLRPPFPLVQAGLLAGSAGSLMKRQLSWRVAFFFLSFD